MSGFEGKKLRVVILVIIMIFFVLFYWFASIMQPKSISHINLQKIVEVPNYVTVPSNTGTCEEFLSSLIDVVEERENYQIGVLPKDHQLRSDSTISECIKSSIAIYSDSSASQEAYQHLVNANGGFDGAKSIYISQDNSTVMFETNYTFETILPILNFDVQTGDIVLKNRLLITEKCNTLVSLYFFVEDVSEESDNYYTISATNEELISYSEQILQQIDRLICPVIVK